MTRLWFDLETRSPIPINEGTYRYAEMVEILLFIYAFDDGEVAVWDVASGAPMPAELHAALSDERVELVAHNVSFDRTVLMAACGDRYPLIPERFYCTMTAARMARMPGSLDALCKALELPDTYAKKDGKALIKRFCIPGPDGHYVQPYDDPGAWKRFTAYAIDDVVAMRECMKRIPDVLNATERALYGYTARMNDRGIRIDKQLAVTCAHQVVKFKAQFKAEARRLTGDDEFNIISQQALLAYLRERGVFLEDARLSTLQDFLESEHATLLPAEVLKVLSTRLKANKAAVAKFPAVIKRLNRDDRLRGLIAHAGAGNTHRDTSVGPQFQNLARPVLLNDEFTMEQACEIAKDGTAELYFEDPMQLLSDCVRGMVIPDPGKKLCVADLSNIEGRSVVWLAKEEWKLQYFRDLDAGKIKYDNYVMAYAKAFGIEPKAVSKNQRQVGKVLELACFGADTKLLTSNGIKRIVDVTVEDLLWDGESWVQHQGVIFKGMRKTISELGFQVTEDHLLLVGQQWLDAKTVLSSPSILTQALATGSVNLPSSKVSLKSAAHASNAWSRFNVRAEPYRIASICTTYLKERLLGAVRAPGNLPDLTEKNGMGWPQYALTMSIAADSWAASLLPSHAATLSVTSSGALTAGGGSKFTTLGSKTPGSFSRTSSRFMVGMIQAMTWIGSISIKVTNRVTCGSLQEDSIEAVINAPSPSYKSVSTNLNSKSESLNPVFDILNCGPRSRFTVVTEAGCLIAHNCSYGGSIGAFITFAAIYRVDLDAMSLAVREAGDPALWKECESSFDWFEEKKMTYGLSLATWTGCYYLVKAWRAAHAAVVESWTRTEDMFKAAIRNPGNWFEALNGCHFFNNAGWVFARLPSGRMMVFPMAREEQGTGKSSITFMGVNSFTRKWGVQRTYGGRLVENFTQSFARDVLLWSVPSVEAAGYPVVLRVHDEFVTETPDDPAFTGGGLAKLMSAGQPWCPGLPLAAVGEDLYRYQK